MVITDLPVTIPSFDACAVLQYLEQVHIDIVGPTLRVATENGRGSGRS